MSRCHGAVHLHCQNRQLMPHFLLPRLCRAAGRPLAAQRQQRVVRATAAAAAAAAADGAHERPTWASHVSRRINLALAVEEAVAGALARGPPGWAPTLVLAFVSSAYSAELPSMLELLRNHLPSVTSVFGSTVWHHAAFCPRVITSCTRAPSRHSLLCFQNLTRTPARGIAGLWCHRHRR